MSHAASEQGSSPARTVTFQMDGEAVRGTPGQSIAAALIAAGRSRIRTSKAGTPRGVFCGMGVCFECQVTVDGGPAVRACLEKVTDGSQVKSLDYCVPVDRCATPQAISILQSDVLVIGAGPAGLAAATALANAGCDVMLVDERAEAGGQYYKQPANADAPGTDSRDEQYRAGARAIARMRASAVDYRPGATAWGAFRRSDGLIECGVVSATASFTVEAKHLVIATGAYESVPHFPGWTLPGVMTTGAAQGLLRAYGVSPGQRVLVAGNGPLNLHLACELLAAGVDVVAVAESAKPGLRGHLAAAAAMLLAPALVCRGLKYLRVLRMRGVPILKGFQVERATGGDRVGQVAVTATAGAAGSEPSRRFDVDTLCVGYSLLCSNELARALDCRLAVDGAGRVIVARDARGRTSVANVHVAGDCAAVGGAHIAESDGVLVADAICRRLTGKPLPRSAMARLRRIRHHWFQRLLWRYYAGPTRDVADERTEICRCETVGRRTIEELIDAGVDDLGGIKRETRAGMGNCQGRYCQARLAAMLGHAGPRAKPEELMFAPRVPVKPVPVASLLSEVAEWKGYKAARPPARQARPHSGALPRATDVLVVGGGIIGTATALFLAERGVDVIVADAGPLNGSASGSNAGSLHLQVLSSDFALGDGDGANAAVNAIRLQMQGLALWKTLQDRVATDFELVHNGGLVVAESHSDLAFLERKVRHERAAGLEVRLLDRDTLRQDFPAITENCRGAAWCADEGKINPMLATPALQAAARRNGAVFRPGISVTGIRAVADSYAVTTNAGTIQCNKLVIAAGGWTAGLAAMLGVQVPVQTAPQQMIVTEPAQPVIPCLLAMAGRHLTMKQAGNGNVIIGGGWPAEYGTRGDLATTTRSSIQGNLWAAHRIVPAIGNLQVLRTWATTGVMIDGAPLIDELDSAPGVYLAVGANGYTMGPAIGKALAELIAGDELSVDIEHFGIDRFDA